MCFSYKAGLGEIRIPAHLPHEVASYKDVNREKVTVTNVMVPRFISMKETLI